MVVRATGNEGELVLNLAGCDPSKPNIVWDLDNTLISAVPTEEFPFWDSDVQKRIRALGKPYDMDGYYVIYERPGLQKFLDWVFAHFNVSIWTAATKDYCTFICKEILVQRKKKRKICWTFFSYHRKMSSKRYGGKSPKDLRMLWDVYRLPGFGPRNTVIVDDHPDVYKAQPDNCVHCPEFETLEGGEKDDYIPKLRKGMEAYLKKFRENPGGIDKPALLVTRESHK